MLLERLKAEERGEAGIPFSPSRMSAAHTAIAMRRQGGIPIANPQDSHLAFTMCVLDIMCADKLGAVSLDAVLDEIAKLKERAG